MEMKEKWMREAVDTKYPFKYQSAANKEEGK